MRLAARDADEDGWSEKCIAPAALLVGKVCGLPLGETGGDMFGSMLVMDARFRCRGPRKDGFEGVSEYEMDIVGAVAAIPDGPDVEVLEDRPRAATLGGSASLEDGLSVPLLPGPTLPALVAMVEASEAGTVDPVLAVDSEFVEFERPASLCELVGIGERLGRTGWSLARASSVAVLDVLALGPA